MFAAATGRSFSFPQLYLFLCSFVQRERQREPGKPPLSPCRPLSLSLSHLTSSSPVTVPLSLLPSPPLPLSMALLNRLTIHPPLPSHLPLHLHPPTIFWIRHLSWKKVREKMQPSSARDHSDHARRVSGTRYMETRNNPCPACLVRLQRSPLTCYGRDVEEQHASSTAVHVLTSAHKVCSQSSVRESSIGAFVAPTCL